MTDEHRAVVLTWFRANEEAICGDSFPVASLSALLAEREAAARAVAIEECRRIAARYGDVAVELESMGHHNEGDECRLQAKTAHECARAILTPDPELVVVRRGPLGALIEAAKFVLVAHDELQRKRASTRLTPAERETLRGLVDLGEKATPGTWTYAYASGDVRRPALAGWPYGVAVCAVAPRQRVYSDTSGGSYPDADARFIAAARNAVAIIARLVGDRHAD